MNDAWSLPPPPETRSTLRSSNTGLSQSASGAFIRRVTFSNTGASCTIIFSVTLRPCAQLVPVSWLNTADTLAMSVRCFCT